MLNKYIKLIFYMLIFPLLLSGCNQTINSEKNDEVVDDSQVIVENENFHCNFENLEIDSIQSVLSSSNLFFFIEGAYDNQLILSLCKKGYEHDEVISINRYNTSDYSIEKICDINNEEAVFNVVLYQNHILYGSSSSRNVLGQSVNVLIDHQVVFENAHYCTIFMYQDHPFIIFEKEKKIYIYEYNGELQLIDTILNASVINDPVFNDRLFAFPICYDHSSMVCYYKDDHIEMIETKDKVESIVLDDHVIYINRNEVFDLETKEIGYEYQKDLNGVGQITYFRDYMFFIKGNRYYVGMLKNGVLRCQMIEEIDASFQLHLVNDQVIFSTILQGNMIDDIKIKKLLFTDLIGS